MRKKFLEVAKFEFLKTVKKPSFWVGTLFFPIFMGVIMFISASSTMTAMDKLEDNDTFTKIYIEDNANLISEEFYVDPFVDVNGNTEDVKALVKSDPTLAYISIPADFLTSYTYEVYYKENGDIISGTKLPVIVSAFIRQSALRNIDPTLVTLMQKQSDNAKLFAYDKDGVAKEVGLGKYVLPVISMVVFFMLVFISSTFLLDSVSSEKENRMIETMLSIVDKKSLMFGKMLGLVGVVLTQLITWVGLGVAVYFLITQQFNMSLPINLNDIDLSVLPLNIIMIILGFLFFASIMVGVGSVGTGAQDSKNLSSIFIILAILPMYTMQMIITDPNGLLATFFSYFPFSSFMILTLRNSLGVLPVGEVALGIALSVVYVAIALFIALKLFEIGCLMYNRRPSFSEVVSILRKK